MLDVLICLGIAIVWITFYWHYKKRQYQKWCKDTYGIEDNSDTFCGMIKELFRK